MRLMSFAATTEQMRDRSKTVTRRLDSKGHWMKVLKPGTLICAVEKGQGIPKGEQIQRIGVIEIVDVRRERLWCIDPDEVEREGFPGWSVTQFLELFHEVNRTSGDIDVTRIEFKHRPDLSVCCGAELAQTTYWTNDGWACSECGGEQ